MTERHRRWWTANEVALLEAWYEEVGCAWDGWTYLLPDRSERDVAYKAHALGLRVRERHHRGPFSRSREREARAKAQRGTA